MVWGRKYLINYSITILFIIYLLLIIINSQSLNYFKLIPNYYYYTDFPLKIINKLKILFVILIYSINNIYVFNLRYFFLNKIFINTPNY